MTKNPLLYASAGLLLTITAFDVSVAQQRGPQDQPILQAPPPPRPPAKPVPNHATYRTIDGTNNNIAPQRGDWGAADVALFRELPAEYGPSDPKNALGGVNRPSARKISNVLCDEPTTIFNSRNLSAFVYVWGQFLDHDITLTPTGTTESVPIALPNDEPLFNVPIPFTRSEVRDGTGTNTPRQQSNLNTAWIDASVVYGSDETRAKWLRTFKGGKLKTSTGNFLPWNTTTGEKTDLIDPNAPSMANDNNHTVKTLVAGDLRATEHPGITSIHTIFVREHNKICDRLKAQGLTNDEEIYQRARKEVGALIQAITYQEFLPALGVNLANYSGYKDNVRPDIMNTFATAGYRIGHTMVADEIALRDNNCQEVPPGDLELLDVFFTPSLVIDYGTDVFLKGLSTHKQYETDTKINSTLRDFLFGSPTDAVRFGLDLAALNIQRGRDHGLPNYNAIRDYYLGNPVSSFGQITSNPTIAAALQTLYGNVNNIDLWVGALSEDRLPGKSVGRTMDAMLRAQFEKLRDGDFYFFMNDPFLPQNVRDQVRNTKLSDLIKRNTSLTNLQNNVFFINPCPGETGERLATSAEEDIQVKMYPNPVKDIITVELSYTDEPSTIKILTAGGLATKALTTLPGERVVQLNVGDMANGVYFLNVSNTKQSQSLKFVKMAE
ncbi:MAG: peroxidase family protein [Spirosomataceae bacterium]